MKSAILTLPIVFIIAALFYAGKSWQSATIETETQTQTQTKNEEKKLEFVHVQDGQFQMLWFSALEIPLSIKNLTDSEVKIDEWRSDCDCTVLTDKPDILGPNEEYPLMVRITSKELCGAKTSRIVALYNNKAAYAEAEIQIKVNPTYTFEPNFLHLHSPENNAKINFNSEAIALLPEYHSDSPWITAEIKSDHVVLHVNYDDAPPGISTARLIFCTSDDLMPKYSVNIKITNSK